MHQNYGEALPAAGGAAGGGLFAELAKRAGSMAPLAGGSAMQPGQKPGLGLSGAMGSAMDQLRGQPYQGIEAQPGQLAGAIGGAMGQEPVAGMPGGFGGAVMRPQPPVTSQFGYKGGGMMGDMLGKLSGANSGY